MRTLYRFVLAAVLGLAFAPRAAGDDLRHAFEGANRAFAAATTPEEFREVAARFESLRANGGECGDVLFNLGNAWFRAGEIGRAIACYREAERYLAGDPFLAANLAEARRLANVAAPEPSLTDRLLFWRAWLSYPDAARLAFYSAIVAFALGALARCGVKRLAMVSTAAAPLAALALVVFALEFRRHELTRHGVVVVAEVVARKGDAESYGPAFTAPLVEGQEVRVLEARGGWARVQLQSGIDGWVPEDALVEW